MADDRTAEVHVASPAIARVTDVGAGEADGRAASRWAQRVLWGTIAVFVAVMLAAPILPLADPSDQTLADALKPPVGFGGSFEYPLGTDQHGRDMLARMIFGARLSMMIAAIGVVCAGVIGTTLGIAAGYAGRWVDFVVSRLIEAQLALPFMLLAVALIVTRGQSLPMLIFVLATYGWAEYARVLRAEVMSLKERPFVTGLRVAGASSVRIMARHVLPNVGSTVLVVATLQVGFMVLGESALSFLGLGVTSPDVSWGLMLAEGRQYFNQAWWVVVLPGVAIIAFVLLVNLTGDAMRRRHDPRQKVYSS